MKAQEFRNLIREEIQKVLKEASLNELKEMDFNKLQKIFAYITTPQEDLWDPIKVEKEALVALKPAFLPKKFEWAALVALLPA